MTTRRTEVNGRLVEFAPWPHEGAWVEVGSTPEDLYALAAPMHEDGGFDPAEIFEIVVPYGEA